MLYVDLHLVHEVTSPQAFAELRERGLRVRRPDRTVATMDHSTPTTPRGGWNRILIADDEARDAARHPHRELPGVGDSRFTRSGTRGRGSCT